MGSLENYREIVKQLLTDYAQLSTANDQVRNETIFDLENDRYILISLGWSEGQRIHHCVMHIDIIEGQVWIEANNTDYLIAEELVKAGIPSEVIVLGLQPPEVRTYTAYGVSLFQKQQESLKL